MSSLPLPFILLALIGLSITLFGAVGLWRRKQEKKREAEFNQPLDDLEPEETIIAVRKQTPGSTALAGLALGEQKSVYTQAPPVNNSPYADDLLVINVYPKEGGENFEGFQLLQAVLGAGFRYGDMQIFHRHQDALNKGPVLFSLASSISPGTFDMEKIGLLSCPGLTIFMRLVFQAASDLERFEMMLDAANQIADEIHGTLQNERRQPLDDDAIQAILNRLDARNVKLA